MIHHGFSPNFTESILQKKSPAKAMKPAGDSGLLLGKINSAVSFGDAYLPLSGYFG